MTYTVVATPEPDGQTIHFEVPDLADTSTVALDLLEGEVLIRQAIAIQLGTDIAAFDLEFIEATPGL